MFSSVFEQFSFTSKFFWIKNAKINFLKKNDFESIFFELTFRWLQTGLSDLKNTKQLNFAYGGFFYAFLKCCIFFNFFFEIFEIYLFFLVRLLNALIFI